MKKCSKCSLLKSLNCFNKNKQTKDGYRPDCIQCHRLAMKRKREQIKTYLATTGKIKGNKQCSNCLKSFLVENFHSSTQRLDGYVSKCKSCVHAKYIENRDHILAIRKRYDAKRKLLPLCRACDKPNIMPPNHAKLCLQCWLNNLTSNIKKRGERLGQTVTEKQLIDLRRYLFEKCSQISICPYTGEQLIPGWNLSVDHILSASKQPELIAEVSNLQVVSRAYNWAKHDMNQPDFILFCKTILEHTGYECRLK